MFEPHRGHLSKAFWFVSVAGMGCIFDCDRTSCFFTVFDFSSFGVFGVAFEVEGGEVAVVLKERKSSRLMLSVLP